MTNPLTLHKYVYGNNDPIGNHDPTGMFSEALILSQLTIGTWIAAASPHEAIAAAKFAAWKANDIRYDSLAGNERDALRKQIKAAIVREANTLLDSRVRMDCADVAVTSIIRAAASLQLPLRLKIFSTQDNKYVYLRYGDYRTREEFENDARAKMNALSVIDNSISQGWDDLGAGDLMMYDLRYRNNPSFSGHTMIITGKDTPGGDPPRWETIEGHLEGNLDRNSYTQAAFLGNWNGPYEGKGRYWNWKDIIRND